MRLLCLAVLVAAAIAGGASASAPPVDECVPARDRSAAIRFRAPDGVHLVGVLLGRGRTGVALGHESNANLCTWLPFAHLLAAKGYSVLDFDHRGHGESAELPRAFFRVDRDFLGAVRELSSRGSTRFVLMGASMGGTAALAAAPRVGPSLRAAVNLSGPTSLERIDALPAVKRTAAPELFAVGSQDTAFLSDARELAAASPNPESRLVIRPTRAHGTALLRESKTFRALVLAFVERHAPR